jgi:hypothetical protein
LIDGGCYLRILRLKRWSEEREVVLVVAEEDMWGLELARAFGGVVAC